MADPVAIFCADTHLDLGAWAHRPRLRGDSVFALTQIVDMAERRNVQAVVFAGDFFDVRKPPSEVISAVRRQLDRLQANDITPYFIQGQHDLASPPWLCAIHSGPVWLHRQHVVLGDSINVYGIDWQPADKVQEELQQVPPGIDLLVMHQVWGDFMGDITLPECHFSDLPDVGTIFTGDYHSSVHEQRGELEIISPGATHARAANEPGTHRVTILQDDGSFEWSKLRSRHKLTISVLSHEDLESLPEEVARLRQKAEARLQRTELPEQLATPILVAEVLETLNGAHDEVLKLCEDFAEVFFRTRKSIDPVEQDTIKAKRAEILRRGATGSLDLLVSKSDPRYKTLQRLLSSGADPEEELELLFRDYIAKAPVRKKKKVKRRTE